LKIRTRLFLLLAVLTLVPLALLGVVSYYVAMDAVREKVSEQLEKVTHELVGETRKNLDALHATAREIEADDNVALYLTYLGRRDVSFLREIMGRVLEFQLRREPRLVAIQLFLPDGDSVAATAPGGNATLLADPAEAASFMGGVAVENGIVSIAVVAGRTESPALVVLHAKVDYFLDAINRASIGPDRPVDGFLRAGNDFFTAQTVNEALRGHAGLGEAGLIEFGDRVAASASLGREPFIVGASMPKEEFLAPVRRVRNISLVIILLVALATSGAALVFATNIVRPVNAMVGVTHRLAAGDLDARLTVDRTDELGQLAGDFNLMAGKLKTTIGDLDRSLKELSGLYDASTIIGRSADLDEAVGLAAMLLESGFGIGRAAFFRRSGEDYEPIHVHGLDPAGMPIPADLPGLRRLFAERAAALITMPDDLAMIAVAVPAVLQEKTAVAGIPLVAAGREAGLVLVLAESAPDENLLKLLSVIGSLLSPIVATAAEGEGAQLARPVLEGIEETIARMERLDSRCAVAAAVMKGEKAIAAAEGLAARLRKKTGAVHRLAPNIVVAVLAGANVAEAEATLAEALGQDGHAAIRAVAWPEVEESPEELLARVLAG
jgi:HAMP domain-containing protein